nr:hypothetical protein [Rhodococcus opacus]
MVLPLVTLTVVLALLLHVVVAVERAVGGDCGGNRLRDVRQCGGK